MDDWIRQAELWVGQAESWIRQQPPEQIYVAAAVVAVTILVLIAASCLKSSKPNTIVLSGLSGSGKTTLFYQLRDGSSHQGTVTSMEENNDTFVLHSDQERKGKVKSVHIVDVPGHARLKPKLDEVLPKAAGVIFVVDAQDFLSSMQAAAEYLYDILTKATVVKKKVPVLIFCNKTDKVTAHSKEFIKKQLEKEINKLRESRNAISSADISDEVQLGVPGEAFNFSQCQNKVTVAEGAGSTGNVLPLCRFCSGAPSYSALLQLTLLEALDVALLANAWLSSDINIVCQELSLDLLSNLDVSLIFTILRFKIFWKQK